MLDIPLDFLTATLEDCVKSVVDAAAVLGDEASVIGHSLGDLLERSGARGSGRILAAIACWFR